MRHWVGQQGEWELNFESSQALFPLLTVFSSSVLRAAVMPVRSGKPHQRGEQRVASAAGHGAAPAVHLMKSSIFAGDTNGLVWINAFYWGGKKRRKILKDRSIHLDILIMKISGYFELTFSR